MITPRTLLQTLTGTLRRRRKADREEVRRPTRITTARWARTHTIVHPEKDLSEWVGEVAKRDWDNVVEGKNKE